MFVNAKERYMRLHPMRKFPIWLELEMWMPGVHGGWLDVRLIW